MVQVAVLAEHDIPHVSYILLPVFVGVGELRTFPEHKRQLSCTVKLTVVVQVEDLEGNVTVLLNCELLVHNFRPVFIFLLLQVCINIEILLGQDRAGCKKCSDGKNSEHQILFCDYEIINFIYFTT